MIDKDKVFAQFNKFMNDPEMIDDALQLGYLKHVVQQEDDAFLQVWEDGYAAFIYPPAENDYKQTYYLKIPVDEKFYQLPLADEVRKDGFTILLEMLMIATRQEPEEWNKQFMQ